MTFARQRWLLLAIPFFIASTQLHAQTCKDAYVDEEAHLQICKERGWNVERQLQWIIVKAQTGNVSIYAEPIKTPADTVAQSIWRAAVDGPKGDVVQRPLTVVKTEDVLVGSTPAFLGITHKPPVKTETSMALEFYNIQVVFVHGGFHYFINCNCYREDYSAQEQLVRAVASSIRFIP